MRIKLWTLADSPSSVASQEHMDMLQLEKLQWEELEKKMKKTQAPNLTNKHEKDDKMFTWHISAPACASNMNMII